MAGEGIDTGSNTPIKSRPYYTSLDNRKVIDDLHDASLLSSLIFFCDGRTLFVLTLENLAKLRIKLIFLYPLIDDDILAILINLR